VYTVSNSHIIAQVLTSGVAVP